MDRRFSVQQLAWAAIIGLSIVEAGAAIGHESARYFWDLASYVEALDTPFPYRDQRTFPFLYPPFAKDVFWLMRSHLFELMTIGYVAAAAFFLWSYSQLQAPRKYEWLFAMTAVGGLGIVSIQSGNVAILLNLSLLGLCYQAALGAGWATALLPIAIALGALMKPQFIVYFGLLLVVERSPKAAVGKIVAGCAAVASVYLLYMWGRPFDWNEYVQAVTKRAVVEKDFAWGPAGFVKRWSDSNAAFGISYVAGLAIFGGLALLAWRNYGRDRIVTVSLAFIALTFANPRVPLYDIYTVAIALGACCAIITDRRDMLAWPFAAVVAYNVLPWMITEFARTPGAWPGVLLDLQIGHLLALLVPLLILALPNRSTTRAVAR